MVCSTSIDGKLRIWNLKTIGLIFDSGSPSFLKAYKLGDTLNTVHNIIGADYVPNHKGYIVTWQFTPEVTIWNPQYSVQNPYIGKYTSHLSPVTGCRLLKTSTFCVSVDKKMILRVWDVRTLTTSQVLSLEANFDTRPFLHVLEDDNLLLFGRHPRKLANQNIALRKTHSVCAVGVAFNEYHKKFIVATPIDVRLYDSETGKLQEIFVDLVEAGRNIKCFEQGARHRMFYLGDSAGDVTMFNTKNGQKLKTVTDNEKDGEVVDRFSKIMGMQVQPGQFTSQDRDICCMMYLTDEKLLAVGTGNSIIKIYAEVDSEESELSRVFVGGHMESEITCLSFNRETSQFASGSDNGIVTVWNMSTGKVDNTMYDLPSKVVAISFCQNWSCILIAQAVGIVSVWGLKQVGSEFSGKSVFKLFHLSEENHSSVSLLSIKSMTTFYSSDMVFHKDYLPEEEIYKKEKSMITSMLSLFKEQKKDIDTIRAVNDFTLEDLERDSGHLYFQQSPTIVRQNSKLNIQTPQEYLYVLLGDEKGDLITLDLLPCLKKTKFPSPVVKSDPFMQVPAQTQSGPSDEHTKKVVDLNRAESIMALSQTRIYMNTVSNKVVLRNVFPLMNPAVVHIQEGAADGGITHSSILSDFKTVFIGSSESANTFVWREKVCLGAINLRGFKQKLPNWKYKHDWKAEAYSRACEVIQIEAELNGEKPLDSTELGKVSHQKVKQMFLERKPDLYASALQIVERSITVKERSVVRNGEPQSSTLKRFVFHNSPSEPILKQPGTDSSPKVQKSKPSTRILLNTTAQPAESLADLDTVGTNQTEEENLKNSFRSRENKPERISSPLKQKVVPGAEPVKKLRATDSTTFNRSFKVYPYPDKLALDPKSPENNLLAGLQVSDPREVLPRSSLAKNLQQKFRTQDILHEQERSYKLNTRRKDASELNTPRVAPRTFTGLSQSKVEHKFRLSSVKKSNGGFLTERVVLTQRDSSPRGYGLLEEASEKEQQQEEQRQTQTRVQSKIPNTFQEFMSNVRESYAKMKEASNKPTDRTTSGKLRLLVNLSRGGIPSNSKQELGLHQKELSSKRENSILSGEIYKPPGVSASKTSFFLQNKLVAPSTLSKSSSKLLKANSLYDSQWMSGVQNRTVVLGKIHEGTVPSSSGEGNSIRRTLTHK